MEAEYLISPSSLLGVEGESVREMAGTESTGAASAGRQARGGKHGAGKHGGTAPQVGTCCCDKVTD